jgi:hypothetical protein
VAQRKRSAALIEGYFDWATGTLAKLSAKSSLADALSLAAKVPNARYEAIDSGHVIPVQAPDQLGQLLAGFFDKAVRRELAR